MLVNCYVVDEAPDNSRKISLGKREVAENERLMNVTESLIGALRFGGAQPFYR